MPENSWPENDSFKTFDGTAIDSGGAAFVPLVDEEFNLEIDPAFLQGVEGRRLKSALVWLLLFGVTYWLHQSPWGSEITLGFAILLGLYCARLYLGEARTKAPAWLGELPRVSLMVAAKNEAAVIADLAHQLCDLDYPADRYEVWMIDDASSDRTPEILDAVRLKYPQLRVVHRLPGAGGGKSGALNQVLPQCMGEFLVVFDADAQIAPDFLQRSLGAFNNPKIGAVQLRKAVIQAEKLDHPDRNHFLIIGQRVEMALDAFMRQQQIACGGLGELRGNGQIMRRSALEQCGGWNEETVTDDLDLTLRLHLNHWDIDCLSEPAVYEEGVTQPVALWHQRGRWAEGGFQRYLDYWRLIGQNRLGTVKTLDLVVFIIMQYLMPMLGLTDLVVAIARRDWPIFMPLTFLSFGLFGFCAVRGLRRPALARGETLDWRSGWLVPGWQALIGTLYMTHWLPVMSLTTLRMAIRPKRLKWVKTARAGDGV
ncbi:MAG: glycosyltransferase family 2 protein [Alkalinema sp. RU_4_3]|nr:glycosyltransferase family 2 protein [Alkalinema sp. RU_4_3]